MLYATAVGRISEPRLKRVGEYDLLNFSIATQKYKQGEYVTTWVQANVWGKRAKNIKLTKGELIVAIGDLSLDTYITEDGEERTSLKMEVKEIVKTRFKKKDKKEDEESHEDNDDDKIMF